MFNGLHRIQPPSMVTRILACFFFLLAVRAHASIGLVVGEPFGSFGTMLPVGHASVYFDHLCAATPTRLRPCLPGEPGAVVSRYHDLKATHTDWLAFPASVFFYGVENPAATPTFVTPAIEANLRETYRRAHLLAVVPDRHDKHGNSFPTPYGDWAEGIGAAFDRTLFLYEIDTTPAQDAAILAWLNSDPNARRYTLGRANCADFAATLMNFVLPTPLHRTRLNDFDITNPKSLARQMDALRHTAPQLHLRVFEIPQLPGSLRRSRPLRGSAELFLTTKRYLATLLILQPEFILADFTVYETKGRWTPGADATPLTPPETFPFLTEHPPATP